MADNPGKEDIESRKLHNEIEIQEIEKKIKLKELNKKTILQPATVTLLVAFIGILGAFISNYFQRENQLEIEERKFQYSVYQKALEAKDNVTAARILDFYIKAGLLPGEEGKYSRLLEEGKLDEVPIYSGIYKDITLPSGTATGALRIEKGFVVGSNVQYQLSYNARKRLDMRALTTIVLHGAMSPSMDATAHVLTDTVNGRASAHLLIDRDGSVIQLVPFDFQSFHAAQYNDKSIGIEFINVGQVSESNGSYRTYYGRNIDKDDVECNKDVCWERYTPAQIEKALEICKLLMTAYNIDQVVAHYEIDKRKTDPGPFFPLDQFKSLR